MGADTVSLSGLEKDVYEKSISEGVNNSFDLKDWFKTEQADYNGGAGHVWNHHHGRNSSPFFANEDSAYPVAGNQNSSKGRIQIKKIMGRIRMTEEAMEDLVSSEASFRNGMTDEKTRLIDDISRRENQSLGMDGRGVLGIVASSGSSGATIEMTAPGNVPFSTAASGNFGNRFVDVGMFIAFINPATGALRNTNVKQVVSVNSNGQNIVLTADPTVTAGDYMVAAANGSVTDVLDTSYEASYWGLPALIDDSTNRDNYFGILRSQVPSLQSYVKASTGAMSMDTAQLTSDVMYQKLGGKVGALGMHPSTRREWLKITDADRRYSGADLRNPDPSTKAFSQGDITVDGTPIKALRSIGLQQVFFVDTAKSGFKRYVANEGQFMDKDGSMWLREGTGTTARHAYSATYFRRQQYFCENPGLNARWDLVTGQTLVVVRDL